MFRFFVGHNKRTIRFELLKNETTIQLFSLKTFVFENNFANKYELFDLILIYQYSIVSVKKKRS